MPSDRFVPLSEPVLAGNEWKYVKECLDTGWVSSAGPFVDRFEREVASYVGSARGVAAVNGTAALHLALLACGVKPGDEVLVSDLTFVAPVNAIRYCNAFPVFIDADPATLQIDAAKVERFLTRECEKRSDGLFNRKSGRRVSAIVPVHILGLACEIDRIAAAARGAGIQMIEDATEALGVRFEGRHVGTYGDAGVFSFNGNKIVTAGGGGVVVTDNTVIADHVRYLSTQAKDDPLEYVHEHIGYNYRLTNLLAAVGVAQMEQLAGFMARKREIARVYDAAFAANPSVGVVPVPAKVASNYWLYTVLLPDTSTKAERQRVIKGLNDAGIGARPLWHTIHDMTPFADCQAFEVEHAVRLYERAISLPSGAGLSDADVTRTIATLSDLLKR